MRAICESCNQPQPPKWRPGELCIHCGAAVRSEVRCFWCVKWTPATGAKYCRSCGAEVLPPQQFGAARMLKDAGTDRFTVPKMLKELDPDQIENFSRIYQRHQVALTRHVDELRFLENLLFQHVYSDKLEEELLPKLPWPEAELTAMSAGVAPLTNLEGLAAVQAIEKSTPFPTTRALATLARVRLEDWEAVRGAVAVFLHARPGEPLRGEAALTLTSWQVAAAVGRTADSRALVAALNDPALAAAFPYATAVRRAAISDAEEPLLKPALSDPDPDTAFAAALVLGDVDRLAAALQGSVLHQCAAGRRLIQLGHYSGIDPLLRKGDENLRAELIAALRAVDGPVPELAEAVLYVYEHSTDKRQRARIADALCRRLNPAWVERICEHSDGERSIFQSLFMEKAELPPEAVETVCRFMLQTGLFQHSQYGLADVARRGTLPDTFVPGNFRDHDEKTRIELLRVAEDQLEARGDETLHRFVLGEVFGRGPAKVRAAAWWSLSRWYQQEKYGNKGPFALRVDAIERFFGSVAQFLPRWTLALQDHATLKEVGYYDYMAHLLKYSKTDLGAAFAADPTLNEPVRALVDALIGVIAEPDYWLLLRTAAVDFLGAIGNTPACRDSVLEALQRCRSLGKFDLQDACDRAAKKIRGDTDA